MIAYARQHDIIACREELAGEHELGSSSFEFDAVQHSKLRNDGEPGNYLDDRKSSLNKMLCRQSSRSAFFFFFFSESNPARIACPWRKVAASRTARVTIVNTGRCQMSHIIYILLLGSLCRSPLSESSILQD